MTKPKSVPQRSVARRRHASIEVQIRRGDMVESEHAVAACVVDSAGETVAAYGEVERAVYPRSTIKPLLAMPLLETGAAAAFALNDEEIALACASHTGEPVHLRIAETWLGRLDLDIDALACGLHFPYDEFAAREVLAHDGAPSSLHNNCSGKPLGMLTTALHCGDPVMGYEKMDHPVQQRVRRPLADLLNRDLAAAPTAIDGCSIPTIAVSLHDIAAMMAQLLADHSARPQRAAASRRIVRVMAEHPDLIAGSGRFCTDITRATAGDIVVKSGAEGVAIALLRDQGMAIAVKSLDGARRDAEAAMATLVPVFAPVTGTATAAFARYAAPAIENWRGVRTGAIQVVLAN
jgi:L-asparaginase II